MELFEKSEKNPSDMFVWLLLPSLFKGSIRKRRCVNISYFTLSRFFQRLHNVWCLWIANICLVWISVYTIFTENVNEVSKEKGYNWWLVERCLSIFFSGRLIGISLISNRFFRWHDFWTVFDFHVSIV